MRVMVYLRDEAAQGRPPNLSEFMGLCRQFRVEPVSAPQLPGPVSERGPDGRTVKEMLGDVFRRTGEPLWKTDPAAFDAMVAAHEAMLQRYRERGRIKDAVAVDASHGCGYPGCKQAGTLTVATGGGGKWYCRVHFRG